MAPGMSKGPSPLLFENELWLLYGMARFIVCNEKKGGKPFQKPPCIFCFLSATTKKREQPKQLDMEATWFYKY